MAVELLLATFMVLLIAAIHMLGLSILIRILRSQFRLAPQLQRLPVVALLAATVGIVAIHSTEIWVYAGLYLALHAFRTFEETLYFSTVTYASIGYGDLLMPKQWRILAAIEGGVGVIMLGWSTAFLVSLLTQLKLFRHDWLTGTDEPHD